MNYARIILPAYVLLPVFLFAQTGATCGTAIPLILDGVIKNYSASTSTGNNILCTDNGTTPITWFSLTTNATAQCPLLNVSTSDGLACEIGMYSTCKGSVITESSMCLYDGNGLWAPAETFLLSANTTYYLRIKTSTACTISIGGQFYTPSNDDCSGAFSISTAGIPDNNSCHHAGPGVTSSQLCAFSLENTAFYQFYVDATGNCVINITNISCDNGANNNNNGFQIGFFTGSCASLTWLSCTSGSGSFVQAITPTLSAGTKVYVAIDGNAGSNCAYSIGGINVLGVLSTTLKNFSGWEMGNSNILKWTMFNETDGYYDIERSGNGADFVFLGRINSRNTNGETNYSFEDHDPLTKGFYRLKQTNSEGKMALSNIIKIDRKDISDLHVSIKNPVSDFIDMNITTNTIGKYIYKIINLYGQILSEGSVLCNKGSNEFRKQVSNLVSGQYFIVIDNNSHMHATKSFVK